MVVSALIGRSPTMIYFGQEVGEPGDLNDAAFNLPPKIRTTQYDYWGVETHQRWMNDGKFDGGQLTDEERDLRDFYRRLLNLSATHKAMQGEYTDVATGNERLFAFARWHGDEQLIVVSNFDHESSHETKLEIPADLIFEWQLADGRYALDEQLYGENNARLVVDGGSAYVLLELDPLESVVFELGAADIERHTDFASQFVGPRHVDVWLPKDYEESDKTYRVLYFHDGQNLFNPEWVYYTQTDWGIDETLQRLIDGGEVDDTIVVGIWSTPERFAEYMPWGLYQATSDEYRTAINKYMSSEPTSREYLRFVVEELKPFVDNNYRTKPGRDDTMMMGSSMGALISLYGVIEYPDVFAGAACVSTHWPSSMMLDNPAGNEPVLEYLRSAIPAPGEAPHLFRFRNRRTG